MEYGKAAIREFTDTLVGWGIGATRRVRKATLSKSARLGDGWTC